MKNLKRRIISSLLILSLIFTLSAFSYVNAGETPATGVYCYPGRVNLAPGSIYQIHTYLTPKGAVGTVKYESGIPMWAEVDSDGLVTVSYDAPFGSEISIYVTCGEYDFIFIITIVPGNPTNNTLVFEDVTDSDYFADAVSWALDNTITNGTTDSTFSPNAPCTRAQAVTFLWRAAGSREPEYYMDSFSFTDVSEDDYYYKAVEWALGSGVTYGTTTTTFGPDEPCTRAHIVTFLYRMAHVSEDEQDLLAIQGTPFLDVGMNDWYYMPVIWAGVNNVTHGTAPYYFSPDQNCTRGMIVTFLYRYMGGEA